MNAYKHAGFPLIRLLTTGVITALAVLAGWRLWDYYALAPWTRDGRVRAEVVQITPDVAGLVTAVMVDNDQVVRRGQPLFVIDRARYEIAQRQAQAAVDAQRAALATRTAVVEARRTVLAQDRREAARNDGLGRLVSAELTEQSHARVAEDEAALRQAESARAEIESALAQAQATLALAALNLERTTVTAPADGPLSDITLRVGAYVTPGKPVMAQVDTATLRVEGYFEETKLGRLRVGQAVRVHLMGERRPLAGRIASIAGAIEDRERGPSANLLPNVNPTFSWVRLAQRVPVRVTLNDVPSTVQLIAGRTATVEVLPDPPERRP